MAGGHGVRAAGRRQLRHPARPHSESEGRARGEPESSAWGVQSLSWGSRRRSSGGRAAHLQGTAAGGTAAHGCVCVCVRGPASRQQEGACETPGLSEGPGPETEREPRAASPLGRALSTCSRMRPAWRKPRRVKAQGRPREGVSGSSRPPATPSHSGHLSRRSISTSGRRSISTSRLPGRLASSSLSASWCLPPVGQAKKLWV